MNRCFFLSASSRRTRSGQAGLGRLAILATLTLTLAGLQAPAAMAQTPGAYLRQFPANAQRASMVVTQAPELLLNDQPERLSPGSRIRDTDNRVLQAANLTGGRYLVNYVREFTGLIRDVWILTPDEAVLPAPMASQRPVVTPDKSSAY